MAVIGKLLKNKRAGEARMAWNLPALAGPETVRVTSEAFGDGEAIPLAHAAKMAGGTEQSPPLAWTGVPDATAQVLLVVEDLDSPTRAPITHCLALIDPVVTSLDPGALSGRSATIGVQVLRSSMRRGYLGPAPIKGHGPHRYVFQVFALPSAVSGGPGSGADGTAPLDTLKPRAVLSAVAGPVLARGRLTGTYER